MRSVPEWIGRTDDEKVPPRVRLRLFEQYGGICQLSKRKIMAGEAWDLDHIKAIWRGGQHREANLWPVLKQPHREKSAEEQPSSPNATGRARSTWAFIRNRKPR